MNTVRKVQDHATQNPKTSLKPPHPAPRAGREGCARERSKVTLTSKVISRTFLGICMTPESPSSPDTHTQGLEVVMALLSFLMGMMTARYGITAGDKPNESAQQEGERR